MGVGVFGGDQLGIAGQHGSQGRKLSVGLFRWAGAGIRPGAMGLYFRPSARGTYVVGQRRLIQLQAATREPSEFSSLARQRTSAKAAVARLRRLESLVHLRRLYRNLHRAQYLLQLPYPIHRPPEKEEQPASEASSAAAPSTSSPPKTDTASTPASKVPTGTKPNPPGETSTAMPQSPSSSTPSSSRSIRIPERSLVSVQQHLQDVISDPTASSSTQETQPSELATSGVQPASSSAATSAVAEASSASDASTTAQTPPASETMPNTTTATSSASTTAATSKGKAATNAPRLDESSTVSLRASQESAPKSTASSSSQGSNPAKISAPTSAASVDAADELAPGAASPPSPFAAIASLTSAFDKSAVSTPTPSSNGATPAEPAPAAPEAGATESGAEDAAGDGAQQSEADKLSEDVMQTLVVVAEMQLSAQLISRSLKLLPALDLSSLFSGPGQVQLISQRGEAVARDLRERAAKEVEALPCNTIVAWQQITNRNKQFLRSWASLPPASESDDEGSPGTTTIDTKELLAAAQAAERSAEKFFTTRLRPAVARVRQKVREQNVTLRSTLLAARDIWDRLNGGGQIRQLAPPYDLPTPLPSTPTLEYTSQCLELEIQALERALQEASKQRETQIRRSDYDTRVQMALRLRGMDKQVLELSRELAVYTLQLQLEHVLAALEDEVQDLGEDVLLRPLTRPGTSADLELFIADFASLDTQLGELGEQLQDSISSASSPPLSPAFDDTLTALAADIPDLRMRLGIRDQMVYGGQGITLRRVQLIARENLGKVAEGGNFFGRGLKLLAQDAGYSATLIKNAVLGTSLKPREVSALRRLVLDLLSFVPFTVILIIPLTPLGHVLVFGFIQRYFPDLFPSQFSSQRQELMQRYERLRQQLLDARQQVAQEDVQRDLDWAASVLARVPSDTTTTSSGEATSASSLVSGKPPTRASLRVLELEVARAQRASTVAEDTQKSSTGAE